VLSGQCPEPDCENRANHRAPSRRYCTDCAVDVGGSWLPGHPTTAVSCSLTSIRTNSTSDSAISVLSPRPARSNSSLRRRKDEEIAGEKYTAIIIQPSAAIHRMTSFWTFVGVAASVALALPWDGASPTGPVVAVESLGWTPIPTQPPLSPYDGEMVPMAGKHIFARDYNDRLCGYLNGDSGEFAYRHALVGHVC